MSAQQKWKAANREHVRAYARRWHAANRERVRARVFLAREYPPATRDRPDHCECCGRAAGSRALALDHCHETGKFRGWLCAACNTSIGKLGDNIEGLKRAIIYLEKALG
jgi:hypothetical protein